MVVVAQPMDYASIGPVPSALSGAATTVRYSRDALVVISLAQYIRNLGYQAIASMNDTSIIVRSVHQKPDWGNAGALAC